MEKATIGVIKSLINKVKHLSHEHNERTETATRTNLEFSHSGFFHHPENDDNIVKQKRKLCFHISELREECLNCGGMEFDAKWDMYFVTGNCLNCPLS